MKNALNFIFLATLFFFQACGGRNQKLADLSQVTDSVFQVSEKYESQFGGGRVIIKKNPLHYFKASADWQQEDEELRLSFTNDSSVVEAATGLLKLPDSWQNYDTLVANFKHPDSLNHITLEVAIIGSRGKLTDTVIFRKNQNRSIQIPLHELPLTNGNQPPYLAKAIRFTAFPENPPGNLRVTSLAIMEKNDTTQNLPVADQFGQRIRGTWDQKIHSLEALKQAARDQKQALAELDSPAPVDQFGVKTTTSPYDSTGYFALQKDGNAWWMVTPHGNPFWSLGVTGVRPKAETSDVTIVEDREFLFEKLPAKDGQYSEAFNGPYLSLLAWNVLRKYGNFETWRDRVLARLPKWGFNTIGNRSHPLFLEQKKIPHTRHLSTTESKYNIERNMPDPFNPDWKAYIDSLFAEKVQPHQTDSMLIGYFVDNEQGWKELNLLQADTGVTMRNEWVRFLKLKHGHIRLVNQGWDTDFKNWKEIEHLKADRENFPVSPVFEEDMADFKGMFAEEYFSTVAQKIHKYDSNHLYMGCGFTSSLPPESVVRASGDYLDVISVNMYSFRKQEIRTFHQWTGRPILISEYHLPLKGERQVEPLYKTFLPKERQTLLLNNVQKLLEMPFCIGLHWYQHADEPITGRASDGENQVVGLVDITDQPHRHLIRGIRQIARNMYLIHKQNQNYNLVQAE